MEFKYVESDVPMLTDDYYKLEKEVMDAGKPTQEQIGIAHDLYHKIDHLGKARKIEMPYMKDHLNSILKGDPKPGFGRTDIKKEEVVDEAKDIEAAFDGKDSDYKKLMKDLKRARIKVKDEDEMDGFTIFRLNGSDYAIDKMLNKYPDLQVNEKFKKRFGEKAAISIKGLLNISKMSVVEKRIDNAFNEAKILMKSDKQKIISNLKEIFAESDNYNKDASSILKKLIDMIK